MAKRSLPSIEWIVKKRVDAGIAGYAETICYMKDYLDDSDWSDERKLELLEELKQARKQKRQPSS